MFLNVPLINGSNLNAEGSLLWNILYTWLHPGLYGETGKIINMEYIIHLATSRTEWRDWKNNKYGINYTVGYIHD